MTRRRLFAALSLLSLALCAATIVLWVRDVGSVPSRLERIVVTHTSNDFGYSRSYCGWFDGGIYVAQEWENYRGLLHDGPAAGASYRLAANEPPWVARSWPEPLSVPGLTVYYRSFYPDSGAPGEVGVQMSHWFLALATLVLPIIWVARRLRLTKGRVCHACGYDLRATPNRCPECGTATTAEANA